MLNRCIFMHNKVLRMYTFTTLMLTTPAVAVAYTNALPYVISVITLSNCVFISI